MRIFEDGQDTPQPTDVYALEHALAFNVLDKVAFDPSSGQISLLGHFDDRYRGPGIPYLQHLATLLDSPRPRFTLNWTPESSARVDRLFQRMDSDAELRRMARDWATPFDANGHVTAA